MTLADLARELGAELHGDGTLEITGVAPLEEATPGTLTFLIDPRRQAQLATTRASAVVLGTDAPASSLPSLRVRHPYLAFAQALALFHPPARPAPGVHPTAVVAPTARLGPGASLGAHVVIGDGVRIGRDAVLHPNVTIYPGARIGDDFVAHAGVVVREDVTIGDRVVLHAGAVIGSDGFGFVPLPGGHRKIPQVGSVVLDDDVEIGANTTVDRATLGVTSVGRGTKIDNLVMVAHGCTIGSDCLIAAQTGLAGSTRVGRAVMMGGQVGSAGHLAIGDGSQIAAQSGLHGDVPAGAVYGGYPAVEIRVWRRISTSVLRLPELLRRLRRVEKALGVAVRGGDGEG